MNVQFTGGDEVVALLGASGCGKSMTLKCIAGIEKPDRGKIILDGITLFDSEKRINLTPQERHTGLLFQNYALFPNMTLLQNIHAGAKREKNTANRERLVNDIIDSFGLADLTRHFPHQLSGGQQQRVALARILVSNPRVLLLDEPFSALDSYLHYFMEQEVREIIQRFGRTVVLVSHDRDEVFRLSNKIAVMFEGKIETIGHKKEVFSNPGTRYTAMLTGCKNISHIKKLDERHVWALDWHMELETAQDVKEAQYIGIRMYDLCCENGCNSYQCQVVDEIENPFSYTIMLKLPNVEFAAPIQWETDKEAWRQLKNDSITISLPPERILLLRG